MRIGTAISLRPCCVSRAISNLAEQLGNHHTPPPLRCRPSCSLRYGLVRQPDHCDRRIAPWCPDVVSCRFHSSCPVIRKGQIFPPLLLRAEPCPRAAAEGVVQSAEEPQPRRTVTQTTLSQRNAPRGLTSIPLSAVAGSPSTSTTSNLAAASQPRNESSMARQPLHLHHVQRFLPPR